MKNLALHPEEILEKHRKWFNDEEGGERADLREADLYGANLSGANLSGANLRDASLYWANLRDATLRDADLSGTNLRGANLCGANLYRARIKAATAGPIGSRNDITCYKYEIDEVDCGCFHGALDEFAARIEETHRDHPEHLTAYRAAVGFFRAFKAISDHSHA